MDDLVLRDKSSERLFAMQDANWNVVAIADASSVVQERYAYSPYGVPVFLTSTFTSRATSSFTWQRLFTGQTYDTQTGLHYFRNRMLHSQVGTFITRDPIGYADGLSLYQMVFAIRGIDPFGLLQRRPDQTTANDPTGQHAGTIHANPAYGIEGYYHLCIQVDVCEKCCDDVPRDCQKYAIELLRYDGGRGDDGKRIQESGREGWGPGGVGIVVPELGAMIGIFYEKQWGIFIAPGGKCRSGGGSGRFIAEAVDRSPSSPYPIGSTKEQCVMARCIYRTALAIADLATQQGVVYDLQRQNSNSFIGQIIDSCGAKINDEFRERFILNGSTPGAFYNFTYPQKSTPYDPRPWFPDPKYRKW